MKRLIVAVVGFSAIVALGIYVTGPRSVAPAGQTVQSVRTPAVSTPAQTPMLQLPEPAEGVPAAQQTSSNPVVLQPAEPAPMVTPLPQESKLVFDQEIAGLLSPQTSYEQRQALWKKLKNSGQLAQAITLLEQRVATDPRSADDVTVLGEGYYKQAGATNDVREKAILAMKADQTLEAALNLDPANWEARFTRAVGMSYWPPELNKVQEVIDQFQNLIQQQEYENQQPQFALTYLRLGEQYQKGGQIEAAAQVWQRGAALFPNNTDLAAKLGSTR